MPTSAIAFTEDRLVTGSTDFSYNLMPLDVKFSCFRLLTNLFKQLLVFFILAFFLADYLI